MFIIEPIVTEMNKMLVASSLTLLMVTFMYNKVLTMVVVDSNLMTVICVWLRAFRLDFGGKPH